MAAFSAKALHSNQKQRQITIELIFVKLKTVNNEAFFTDLLVF